MHDIKQQIFLKNVVEYLSLYNYYFLNKKNIIVKIRAMDSSFFRFKLLVVF